MRRTYPLCPFVWKYPLNIRDLLPSTRHDLYALGAHSLAKGESIVAMPETIRVHNACSDPCDCVVGHCACGACHAPEDWILTSDSEMIKSAWISECGNYRYNLTRSWDEMRPSVTWIMLNPSTADHEIDDPTIRKCIGFSKQWGYGSLVVVNLLAWRATDPRELSKPEDPIGPKNRFAITQAVRNGHHVIVGWGGKLPLKLKHVRHMRDFVELYSEKHGHTCCLGKTKTGEPRHPLMLAYATRRQSWPYPDNFPPTCGAEV